MKKIFLFFLFIFATAVYATGVQGITYETYAGGGGSPSITGRTLLTTGTVSNIDFSWGGGTVLDSGRSDGVIVHFYGYYLVPGTGTQTMYFGIDSDDGQKLTVNGTNLVNCWCEQGSGFRNGSITLTGGSIVPIDVWYYENGGGAFVKVYWYNPNVGWEVIPAANFATDPGYWDNSTTSIGTSSGISQIQIDAVNSAKSLVINQISGNKVNLETYGTANAITIEQSGFNNDISIIPINGGSNSVNIKQGDTLGKNLINLSVTGSNNTIAVLQARDVDTGMTDANESGGHFINSSITGNSNNLSLKQGNDGWVDSGHFMKIVVSGSNNQGTVTQRNDNNKTLFVDLNGNYDIFNVTQSGTGRHFADISLTGNGHQVSLTQTGTGTHNATVKLTNAGGVSNLSLTQQGSNNQSYSIQQSCANLAGCSVIVNQQ